MFLKSVVLSLFTLVMPKSSLVSSSIFELTFNNFLFVTQRDYSVSSLYLWEKQLLENLLLLNLTVNWKSSLPGLTNTLMPIHTYTPNKKNFKKSSFFFPPKPKTHHPFWQRIEYANCTPSKEVRHLPQKRVSWV